MMDELVSVFLFAYLCSFIVSQNVDTYGPYNMNWKYVTKCKGGKKVECENYTIDFDKTKTELMLALNVTKRLEVAETRIIMYAIKQKSKKVIVQYNIKKPCNHFLLGQYYAVFFNSTKDCVIPKKPYMIKIQLSETTRKFFGAHFFYGEYLVKGYTFSKTCNLICLESMVAFEKQLSPPS